MSEFDAIRKVLNRPTFQDQDEMEILTGEMSDVTIALEMLLVLAESVQAEVTLLKNDLQESN